MIYPVAPCIIFGATEIEIDDIKKFFLCIRDALREFKGCEYYPFKLDIVDQCLHPAREMFCPSFLQRMQIAKLVQTCYKTDDPDWRNAYVRCENFGKEKFLVLFQKKESFCNFLAVVTDSVDASAPWNYYCHFSLQLSVSFSQWELEGEGEGGWNFEGNPLYFSDKTLNFPSPKVDNSGRKKQKTLNLE